MDGYFRRIGINHLSLDLSTTYYLKQGYIAISAFILLVSMFQTARDKPAQSYGEVLRDNGVVLFMVVMLFLPYPRISHDAKFNSILSIISVGALLAILTWQKKSVFHRFAPPTMLGRLFLILFIFAIVGLHASNDGQQAGKRIVEANRSTAITFVWKDTSPKELDGKQLILVIHNRDKYYVVERSDPAPDYPHVFIIPDEMVKYATTSESQ